jgi:hypothetical protein
MRDIMDKHAHMEWFEEFFGAPPGATFTISPGLLNGGSCYAARCVQPDGQKKLYCIMGIWITDSEGLPQFGSAMVQTAVHEFGHSFANPVIDRHYPELRAAGEALFGPVAATMRSQAYADGRTLLFESLVRACEVRYALRYNGTAAGSGLMVYQKRRGFLWTKELSDVLGEYEAHRDKFPTLESFAPRLVAFFNGYARGFAERLKALEASRPKVVSMLPKNGATNVDPNQATFKVVFDRRMQDGSWALVGDASRCPEGKGPPRYDESRTTWSVPVKLKPNFTYTFMLNSDACEDFKSEAGVPLEPLTVNFTTADSTTE